ncbi:unnamed protein product, partial [Tetraodon nigroviridis]
VKKPPLAPKPKFPATKPCPPPIAPKPGLLLQSLVASQPSPSTLKRTKPAVAPKPCLPKSNSSSLPASPPPPKPSDPVTLPHEQEEVLEESLSILNSKNGILSETNKWESDYIIPTCPGGAEDSSRCHQPLENGNTSEIKIDLHEELRQNGVLAGGVAETRPGEKADPQVEECEGGRVSRRPRDKPQRQRHLARKETRENAPETLKHPGNAGVETGLSNTHAQACDVVSSICPQTEDVASSICPQTEDVASSICPQTEDVASSVCPQTEDVVFSICPQTEDVASSVCPQTEDVVSSVCPQTEDVVSSICPQTAEPPQGENDGAAARRTSPTVSHRDRQVPAAPSKPLPVPQPRRLKKPTLVRQDGVEAAPRIRWAEDRRRRWR